MSKKARYSERDIVINDVCSRIGKATGNMYLTLAKHKKQKLKEDQPKLSSSDFFKDRRQKI